jgi:hypothetical protein
VVTLQATTHETATTHDTWNDVAKSDQNEEKVGPESSNCPDHSFSQSRKRCPGPQMDSLVADLALDILKPSILWKELESHCIADTASRKNTKKV